MASLVAPRFRIASMPVRKFAVGVGAGNHMTPGFEPAKGTAIPESLTLQKARSWDEGVADKFKASTISEICKGKRVAFFTVPGPYTGTCENAHVPSFSANAAALKAKGVDKIVCISVCDPYVLNGWARSLGDKAAGIEFYADDTAKLSEFMHTEVDLAVAALCGKRSNRYAMVTKNGVIEVLNKEAKPSDLLVSDGASILKAL